MPRIDNTALDQIFRLSRSHPAFEDRPVAPEVLEELTALALLGPSAFNQQPLRLVFVQTAEGKARLEPALSSGNRAKTMAAPVSVLVCCDTEFTVHLPQVFPLSDVRGYYTDPAVREASARTNALLQAGMLIAAARSLGLGVGPMAGFDKAKAKEALLGGTSWEPLFLMNLGWFKANPDTARLPRLGFDTAARIV
ncbi:3-hydroxypropanoate dehydrogenase [Gemmobacter megaterium]|uniref:3-hydroxypropanoate dehydrogenase n=1 Tax=Gemmobacter megaterium TaxID=1086013 RepID=A0A1N7KIJ9_9RHOB|nr:malonic semialdehyde reductase [Gemmobacter megaterium]GGE02340.1 putative NADH dehydrogenase/NAD(P)H nitroreductase [Gemmobacter megaterium]SIS61387.1 3-hydroxypropanoate dehydrogenase [Gemmobacter megaterium]